MLVHRDLYDVLITALACAVKSPVAVNGRGALDAVPPAPSSATIPTAATPPSADDTLSATVVLACRDYGYGEQSDIATNLQTARHMRSCGATDTAIMQRIRDGANLTSFEPSFI